MLFARPNKSSYVTISTLPDHETFLRRNFDLVSSFSDVDDRPIVAVVVGAATSYIVAIATERARWKRADQVWLNDRRIDAYTDFAHALRRQIASSTQIAAERGFHIRGWTHPIHIDDGLVALADAKDQRALAYHRLMLVGDDSTIAAAVNSGRKLTPFQRRTHAPSKGQY
jgi:hypothetical protein